MKPIHFIALLLFLFLCSGAAVSASELGQGQNSKDESWRLGLGIGPNITQFDFVTDDLGSSNGGSFWASRSLSPNTRLDLTLDYFLFNGSARDYLGLSAAYGIEILKESRVKTFALIGAGFGAANHFPRSENPHQKSAHLFTRIGMDELYHYQNWNVGLIYDFMFVDLDDKPASSAQLGLPMVTFTYKFGSELAPEKESKTSASLDAQRDTDHDGVKDSKDECPDTPTHTKVNSIGCALKMKVRKELRVQFVTGKSVIDDNFIHGVDEFATFLKENPDILANIEGHTDSVGSRDYNLSLSKRRAKAVRNALIERGGIDPRRVKAQGFGPDKPEDSNETVEGRQTNRRVIAILYSEE